MFYICLCVPIFLLQSPPPDISAIELYLTFILAAIKQSRRILPQPQSINIKLKSEKSKKATMTVF